MNTDNKKDWLVVMCITLLTVLISLAVIALIAPQLLGRSSAMLWASDEVAPFFESVFREEDRLSDQFIVAEPLTSRAIPLYPVRLAMGPHDLLGFRNHGVPNRADIVTIGDSQTYGNNAYISDSWPQWLRRHIRAINTNVYSMSVGGWGAIDYLHIFPYALRFNPGMIIVAFYSGNDPIESFKSAYGNPYWRDYRPDPSLDIEDVPRVSYPPKDHDKWPVNLGSQFDTVFTPEYRAYNVQAGKVIDASFDIMFDCAEKMSAMAKEAGVTLIFTIIPTKELVYAKLVQTKYEEAQIRDSYRVLINNEQRRITEYANKLSSIDHGHYVDLVDALQKKVLEEPRLYPEDTDGHPLLRGYQSIAQTLLPKVEELLVSHYKGPVSIDGNYYLVLGNEYWLVRKFEIFAANEWRVENMPLVRKNFLDGRQFKGELKLKQPKRFSPRYVKVNINP